MITCSEPGLSLGIERMVGKEFKSLTHGGYFLHMLLSVLVDTDLPEIFILVFLAPSTLFEHRKCT